MPLKLLSILAVLALAPFALAACGGDDEEEGGADTAATTTEETTTGETGGGAGGGAGGTLEVAADPTGALEFEQESLQAQAGEVTIDFTNDSSVPHDVRVEDEQGGDIGGTEVITSSSAEATVELEPGDYTFYCSVPGHRESGMEGELTVN